jgi:diguanylate cyclase (GGDEF)-like protein/PAS domain S-box-containing protein
MEDENRMASSLTLYGTRQKRYATLFIPAMYLVIAGLWIVASDWVVASLPITPEAQNELQTYKGWAFVIVTACLLALAMHIAYRKLITANEALERSRNQLELALSSAGGGIWDRDLVQDTLFISPQMKASIGCTDSFPDSLAVWHARIHPDDRDAVNESIDEAISGQSTTLHDARYRIQHQDGDYRWLHSRARVIHNKHGQPIRMIGVALNISAQMEAERQLAHLIRYDSLTGLANRSSFHTQLDDLLAQADGKTLVVIMRVDIDRFKEVNDEFGPEVGDKVLQMIADRIEHVVGSSAIVGRLGADEFAVGIPHIKRANEAQRAARNLSNSFAKKFKLGDRSLQLSASIGVAVYPTDGESSEQLIRATAVALTNARSDGWGNTRFFATEIDESFRLRVRRSQELREATRRGELEVHFQPIVSLRDGVTAGFEALVRWQRPDEGLVPPDQFIGLAEELGYIGEIGRNVLQQACKEAKKWQNMGDQTLYVAVNVSPRQFDDPDFVSVVRQTLADTGLRPSHLELEITETALSRDPEAAQKRLSALRDLGVSVAIDDFGTGYSSLGALERLPLSRLKIDKSFIALYGSQDRTTVIVESILSLAQGLNLPVTAEGVETREQLALLNASKAEAAQGYLFSKPVKHDAIEPLIGRNWGSI